MTRKVDAFNVKGGPTESGVMPTPPPDAAEAVAGELLPFNLFKALPVQMILLLLLMIPVFVILYKKRDYALSLVYRLFF